MSKQPIHLSKSQAASLCALGYFVLRAVIDAAQAGKLSEHDLLNAALAGLLAGCRSLIPPLSGK